MRGDRSVRWAAGAALVAGLVVFLAPIGWMVSTSVKAPAEAKDPLKWVPSEVRLENFPEALDYMNFAEALANTVVVTVFAVAGQVLASSLVGYGFAKFRFPGREVLFIVMLATMMLPPQVTMIPVFVLFRSLGLVDTLPALFVRAWVGAPFFIYMFRQFFSRIPEGILEAARVDGASNWRVYWRIMLPMSWPVIAVVAVYTFIWTWNDYLQPLIYINSPEKYTLALALAGFSGQYGSTEVHLLMAASLVTMMPCLVLFFAAQRYFIRTELGAAMKG
jgi:ABC-type glycerol-3-phosphate transport system permease component